MLPKHEKFVIHCVQLIYSFVLVIIMKTSIINAYRTQTTMTRLKDIQERLLGLNIIYTVRILNLVVLYILAPQMKKAIVSKAIYVI